MLDLISQRPRTCDEIVALGFAHQSASAAINWLMRQGHIVPSGEKRRTRMGRRAIVWRHEENPQPLVRTRPTRRELERELAQRDAERDALAAEVAALKAHDSLAEMWAALAEYQPQADANGHGESWRKMCEERTEEAAAAAYRSPQTLSRIAHAAYNAWWASQRDAAARSTSKEAVVWATNAVAAIRRAKEAKR
jgi:hypothetical protein